MKIILKFLIRDEFKKLKKLAYSKVIELTNPLTYFNEDIKIDNINLSDTLVIRYNKLNEPETEENRAIIKIKKLKTDIEEDAVWTIGNYSFINLFYELMSMSKNKKLYMSQILNSAKIENNKNIKLDSILGDLNGEFGGEATCSTGSTGKRDLNNQFFPEKINNNNQHFDLNSFIIINDDNNLSNLQKKFIKDEDNLKNVQKNKNKDNLNNSINSTNYQILEDNYIFNDENNIFSKEYISKLNFSEFQYDTFCQSIIITGIKFGKTNLIEKSEEFPSSCGHEQCSILKSCTPSILYSYQNPNNKYQIDINDLTPYLIFPLGIKICMAYDSLSEYPKQNKPFMNRIENKKGESFYIISLIYYKQMTFKKFKERYKINPLLSYSNNNKDKKFEKDIEMISIMALNETIFVPECISLVSRFPYFYQIGECLKSLITISDNNKINQFINHLINQIPVPYKNQEIIFYIPNNKVPLKLLSPFNFNLSNFQFINIFNYFSNEAIITIFYLILMEQQILFIHNDLFLLSSISFLFLNFIYPFSWSNTYIPVLSFSSVKFLESIIPYIMGVDESLLQYSLENQYIGNKVIFVNIKNNDIYLNNKKRINLKNCNKLLDLPKFPEKIENLLNKKLDEIRKLKNNSLIIENLKYIFCKIMVVILNDYLEHCFIIEDDIIFNNESYLDRKKPEDKNFYKELIQTQLFSQFLLSRKEQFIKNQFFLKNKSTNKIDYELYNQEAKISSNIYGNMYEDSYIDYSIFHNLEKYYSLRYKNLKFDILSINGTNKSKKAIDLNKSTKLHTKYSLRTLKNNIEKKLTKESYNNEDNNYNSNTISNYSTKKIAYVKDKNNLSANNSSKDEKDNIYMEYLDEKSNNFKYNIYQKNPKNDSKYLLFPYFFENLELSTPLEDKDLYIKNKISEIIDIDKEINKIIKTKNVPDYIVPSYKRYEFYLIKEDYKRYFTNSIKNNSSNSESGKGFSSDFSSENEDNVNNENLNNEDIENKKRININNNIKFLIKKKSINNKEFAFINEWYNIICSSDKKKFRNIETNILVKLLLNKNENLEYFTDLLFQDYIPLFKYINSNYKKILTHECLNELYKVIIKILPSLKNDDKLICKQLTLSFFIYGYYNQKLKSKRFIISKISDLFNSSLVHIEKICPLWGDPNFWNYWLLNDLETYKNNIILLDIESNSFEGSNENNSNIENNEYEYLLDICKILKFLGKNKNFVKNCIFDSVAPKYLSPNEIITLENEVFII